MSFDPGRHHRRSVRLRGWDYTSAGAYFVTICVHGRVPALGRVSRARMVLSPAGSVVEEFWVQIPLHHAGVTLDRHVVMPDHVHGIIVLPGSREGLSVGFQRPATGALATVVGSFKAAAAYRIRAPSPEFRWQRGYHERIIRDDVAMAVIRRYIDDNPRRWAHRHD